MKHFVILATLGLLASVSLGTPIFSEDFTTTATAGVEPELIGWSNYFTAGAYRTDLINPQPNTGWNAGTANPDGGFLNSFLGAGSTTAFGFRHMNAADKIGLFVTDGSMGDNPLAANTDVASLDQLTFTYKDTWSVANPANGIAIWRLALKVDGQWYASVDTVGPSKVLANASFDITTDAADWQTLAFTAGPLHAATVNGNTPANCTWPGSTGQLALGNVATTDLSGNVQALGFYVDFTAVTGTTGNFNLAFDNVVLTPEPATLSVLALGGLAMLYRRRR